MAERSRDDAAAPPLSAQDELNSILLEAKTSRRSKPAGGVALVPDVVPEPAAVMPELPQDLDRADSVRFHNVRIDVSDPGAGMPSLLRPSPRTALALVLGAVALLLWVAMPGGLDALRPGLVAPSYSDASSRWALVLTAERIDRFLADHSRLPATLAELGDGPTELITYEMLGDSGYRLQAPGERSVIVLDSSTPPAAVLGTKADVLRGAPGEAK